MNEERGELAFKLHEKIIANEELRRQLLGDNSKLLAEIYDGKYYHELLGDEQAPWAGYLANVEVFYTRSRTNYLIRIYKRYTNELGINPHIWIQVPLTRLMDVLHIVNSKNYEDWFSKALVLTTRDWNIEVRRAKGKTTEEDEHKHVNETYDICTQCGKKEKHHHDTRTAKEME